LEGCPRAFLRVTNLATKDLHNLEAKVLVKTGCLRAIGFLNQYNKVKLSKGIGLLRETELSEPNPKSQLIQ